MPLNSKIKRAMRDFDPRFGQYAEELISIAEMLKNSLEYSSPLEAVIQALVDLNLLARQMVAEEDVKILFPTKIMKRKIPRLPEDLSDISPFQEKILKGAKQDPLVYDRTAAGNPDEMQLSKQRDLTPNLEILEGYFWDMASSYLQLSLNGFVPPKNRSQRVETLPSKESEKRINRDQYWYWKRKREIRKQLSSKHQR